ncbi:IS3 family transposase [Spiroplasma endosymbiont of Poecilobothrus nobilitatus]|uniref:IS3 family transposase n=1 Tax=Spiroplasma endosymbiont of Poecilobothrus nobilitatus TaxID=1209220 RepID=UPI00313C376B
MNQRLKVIAATNKKIEKCKIITEYLLKFKSVRKTCYLLHLAKSAYYDWIKKGKPNSSKKIYYTFYKIIKNVFYKIGRQTYGVKRITLSLNTIGLKCSVKKVRRYLKIANLKPINEPIKRKVKVPKEYLKGKYE